MRRVYIAAIFALAVGIVASGGLADDNASVVDESLGLDVSPTAVPPTPSRRTWQRFRMADDDRDAVREAGLSDRLHQLDRRLEALESRLQSLERRIATGRGAAHSRMGEEGFRGLYRMNRDGTGVEFLLGAPGMLITSDVNWSHDGQRIAMNAMPEVDAFGESHVFIYDLAGPNQGQFVDLGYGATPAWSADDRQIAYMVNGANTGGIEGGLWIMDADGNNRRRIGNAWWPRWSPDGSLICAHCWDRGGELAIYDPIRGLSHLVLTAPGWQLLQWGGAWSPDGERIAFMGSFEGQHHLASIHRDGDSDSITVHYTSDPAERELAGPPFWSADGHQFIFSMRDAESSSRWFAKSYLYSMAADIPSAPVLLEGERIGQINRVVSWSPDLSQFIFSSER